MSQFRVLAGVLRGGRVGGSRWLRGCGAGLARGCVDSRSCSSEATTGPSALTSNSGYVEEMYFAWLEDHKSVHKVNWSFYINNQLWTREHTSCVKMASHPNANKINEFLMLHIFLSCHSTPKQPHTLSVLTMDFSPVLVLGHVLPQFGVQSVWRGRRQTPLRSAPGPSPVPLIRHGTESSWGPPGCAHAH